ncbi:MAG: hypothetical protein COV44_06395 [Deltaproteobacteria bacterium CG11_big_fil_rev_8_21_14_0_20_45_16]|nr:MAG: hypothetical protein COV44_06395 [Deltaproteobacteria bacterium CG11_big_fil_rev_8_21_14_0_20_45_16]
MSQKTQLHFVWGSGGVGKSHCAIREAYRKLDKPLLITLDPSYRLYDLLGLERLHGLCSTSLEGKDIDLKACDARELFEALEARHPSNEVVRWYYQELVKGLQKFRDYLSLLQLADDMNTHRNRSIIVDTPPFAEAVGLHSSITNLSQFFDKSLVKLTTRNKLLNFGMRKIFEALQLFVGKSGLKDLMEFLDWLSLHIDRFQNAAKNLEKKIFDEETLHHIILTPETHESFLIEMKAFLKKTSNVRISINRSVTDFHIPENAHPFFEEFRRLKQKEIVLNQILTKLFPSITVDKIPLQLMGEDTRQELMDFILSPIAFSKKSALQTDLPRTNS